MQPKSSPIFTYFDAQKIPAILYRSRFYIAIFSALLLLACSCKKSNTPGYIANVYEQYFEANVLNTDFKVKLATDNGTDLTAGYADYKFKLLKNTYYDGPMTATKVSNPNIVYTGTWSSNDDFSKLVISITQPTIPTEFIFLNRPWKFTRKALPVMELAPWGTTEAKVLHMERQ